MTDAFISDRSSERHKTNTRGSTYVLGHADAEVQRLLLQGRLYDGHTEYALRLAGLREGMRVLDIGCGPGDVSFIAARIVGPSGSVLGVDAAEDVIEIANARAHHQDSVNVGFQHCAVDQIAADARFDAVIGRLILMHLPDPVAALRQLAGLVRPGGLIAFSENDITATHTAPMIPEFQAIIDSITQSFQVMGLHPAFGTTLHSVFQRAGLPTPHMTYSAPVGGPNDTDIARYGVLVWRLVQPVAQTLGLATPEPHENDDDLVRRWCDTLERTDAVMVMAPMITAWSRVP
jgi:2-polyprenyl-3-methyl-5-hydroxy-6-metoxy-1,4-benzoquinol methylase